MKMKKKGFIISIFCLGIFWSSLEAAEIKLGNLSVSTKENNSLILKKGEKVLLSDDYGVVHCNGRYTLLDLVGKETKLSTQEAKGSKSLILLYEKPDVGYFKRQIVLLPAHGSDSIGNRGTH